MDPSPEGAVDPDVNRSLPDVGELSRSKIIRISTIQASKEPGTQT